MCILVKVVLTKCVSCKTRNTIVDKVTSKFFLLILLLPFVDTCLPGHY